MLLPILLVQCDKRQQINGRFKNVESVAGSGVVEAASGIAALYIDAEGLAGAVDTALVGVTGNAGCVFSNKDRIVVFVETTPEFFAALIEQPLPDEGADYIPIQEAVLE